MGNLTASPDQRRQIGETTPWLFWRDHPSGTGRQGFACTILACTAPNCPCTEVQLVGSLVDERLHTVETSDGGLDFELTGDEDEVAKDPRGEPVGAMSSLRVDYAARTVKSSTGPADDAALLKAWLVKELDEELVGTLKSLVETERRERIETLWDDWQAGDLVGHHEFFPHAAWEPIEWGGRRWQIEDLHCVDPACPCTDVQVVVTLADDEEDADDDVDPFAGTFVVQLPFLSPNEIEADETHLESETELLAIWRTFSDRNEGLAVKLGERRARMKTLNPPLEDTAPAKRTAAPGRNDACPCGSGKKFKKCCGA